LRDEYLQRYSTPASNGSAEKPRTADLEYGVANPLS
jgi:hypothetical protein